MNKLTLLKKKTMATLNSEVGLGRNSEQDQPTKKHSSHQTMQFLFLLIVLHMIDITFIFAIFLEFWFGLFF